MPNLMGMAGGPTYSGYSPNLSDKYSTLGYMTDNMIRVSRLVQFSSISNIFESLHSVYNISTNLITMKGAWIRETKTVRF